MRSTKFPITSIVLLALLLQSCKDPKPLPIQPTLTPKPEAKPAAERAINPRDLYTATCASCHALDGSGQLGEKTNLKHSKLDAKGTKDAIILGKPASGMASFKSQFTNEEIDSLTSHVMRLHEQTQ